MHDGRQKWRPLLHINSGMAKIEDHQEIEDRHAKYWQQFNHYQEIFQVKI